MAALLTFFQNSDYGSLIDDLKLTGHSIIELNTAGISDVEGIYKKMIEVLPIGIPLSGNVHWDAFLDSVWEGITEQPCKKIALVWLGSESLLSAKLSHFFDVATILQDLSISLANNKPDSYRFATFIGGNSKNYS